MNGNMYMVRIVEPTTATCVVVNGCEKVVDICKENFAFGAGVIAEIEKDLANPSPSVWNRGRYCINIEYNTFIEITELDSIDVALIFERK